MKDKNTLRVSVKDAQRYINCLPYKKIIEYAQGSSAPIFLKKEDLLVKAFRERLESFLLQEPHNNNPKLELGFSLDSTQISTFRNASKSIDQTKLYIFAEILIIYALTYTIDTIPSSIPHQKTFGVDIERFSLILFEDIPTYDLGNPIYFYSKTKERINGILGWKRHLIIPFFGNEVNTFIQRSSSDRKNKKANIVNSSLQNSFSTFDKDGILISNALSSMTDYGDNISINHTKDINELYRDNLGSEQSIQEIIRASILGAIYLHSKDLYVKIYQMLTLIPPNSIPSESKDPIYNCKCVSYHRQALMFYIPFAFPDESCLDRKNVLSQMIKDSQPGVLEVLFFSFNHLLVEMTLDFWQKSNSYANYKNNGKGGRRKNGTKKITQHRATFTKLLTPYRLHFDLIELKDVPSNLSSLKVLHDIVLEIDQKKLSKTNSIVRNENILFIINDEKSYPQGEQQLGKITLLPAFFNWAIDNSKVMDYSIFPLAYCNSQLSFNWTFNLTIDREKLLLTYLTAEQHVMLFDLYPKLDERTAVALRSLLNDDFLLENCENIYLYGLYFLDQDRQGIGEKDRGSLICRNFNDIIETHKSGIYADSHTTTQLQRSIDIFLNMSNIKQSEKEYDLEDTYMSIQTFSVTELLEDNTSDDPPNMELTILHNPSFEVKQEIRRKKASYAVLVKIIGIPTYIFNNDPIFETERFNMNDESYGATELAKAENKLIIGFFARLHYLFKAFDINNGVITIQERNSDYSFLDERFGHITVDVSKYEAICKDFLIIDKDTGRERINPDILPNVDIKSLHAAIRLFPIESFANFVSDSANPCENVNIDIINMFLSRKSSKAEFWIKFLKCLLQEECVRKLAQPGRPKKDRRKKSPILSSSLEERKQFLQGYIDAALYQYFDSAFTVFKSEMLIRSPKVYSRLIIELDSEVSIMLDKILSAPCQKYDVEANELLLRGDIVVRESDAISQRYLISYATLCMITVTDYGHLHLFIYIYSIISKILTQVKNSLFEKTAMKKKMVNDNKQMFVNVKAKNSLCHPLTNLRLYALYLISDPTKCLFTALYSKPKVLFYAFGECTSDTGSLFFNSMVINNDKTKLQDIMSGLFQRHYVFKSLVSSAIIATNRNSSNSTAIIGD